MTFQDEKLLQHLKEFGYRIQVTDSHLKITRKLHVPLFIWAIIILFGLFLLIYSISLINLLAGILLIFISLVVYYRNVASQITFDIKGQQLRFKKGLFRFNSYKSFSEVKELRLRTYDVTGSASPFKKGTREYIAEISMLLKNGSFLELFHFERSVKNEIEFAQLAITELSEFTGFQISLVDIK